MIVFDFGKLGLIEAKLKLTGDGTKNSKKRKGGKTVYCQHDRSP